MFPSLLPLLLLLLCSHGGATGQKTSANELAILLDLKAALGAATTTALDSWRPGGNPCSFPGVLCDARGSVSDVDLSHRPLSEYAYTLKVNEKSDVYSFGVVLLELVTGRRPIEPEYGDNKDIVYWVYSNMTCTEGVMELVLDKRIPEWAREEAVKVLRVGVLCTMRLPSLRPSMRAVVQMLDEAGRDRLAPAAADHGGVKDHKEGSEPDQKQEKQRASPQ